MIHDFSLNQHPALPRLLAWGGGLVVGADAIAHQVYSAATALGMCMIGAAGLLDAIVRLLAFRESARRERRKEDEAALDRQRLAARDPGSLSRGPNGALERPADPARPPAWPGDTRFGDDVY